MKTTLPAPTGQFEPLQGRQSVLSMEPARYRKGHSVIMAQGDGSGFKTALHWAIERFGGVWVHRSRGYVFPTKKALRVFRILQRYERMNLTKT